MGRTLRFAFKMLGLKMVRVVLLGGCGARDLLFNRPRGNGS